MNTDPIADLLTRMRNAVKARQLKTVVPHSKTKIAILEVMKRRNFINDYKVIKNSKSFNEVEIIFNPDLKSLDLVRVSKPGQRIYIKKGDIKPILNNYGISILSTSSGMMTGNEAAKAGVGGEFICKIW